MSITIVSNDPSQRSPWLEWIRKKGWDKPANSEPKLWDLLTSKSEEEMIAHKRALKLIEESRKAEVENALARMYLEAQVKKALQRRSGVGNDSRYSALAKTAEELGRKAGEAAAQRTMPTSSPRYGSLNSRNGTLDTSRAPRPSDSYLKAPQLRPASYYQPRPAVSSEPRYVVVDDLVNLAKTGYYTGQFIGDWTDDIFHKTHTALGKTAGVLAANALATVTGMPRTKWSKEDYLGTVWDRKPMKGRGLGAYLQAKREGRDPSEWFAKAEDADFLHDYNPDSMVGIYAKGLAASTFNAASPSELVKAKALKMANAKIGKIKKDLDWQKGIAETLNAIETWEDAANKKYKYR